MYLQHIHHIEQQDLHDAHFKQRQIAIIAESEPTILFTDHPKKCHLYALFPCLNLGSRHREAPFILNAIPTAATFLTKTPLSSHSNCKLTSLLELRYTAPIADLPKKKYGDGPAGVAQEKHCQ